MQTVRVIAIQDFELQGTAVYAGQAVELIPIDAAVRARRGEVSLDPQMRETYQTRDMVAATPVAVAVVGATPEPGPVHIRRPRRRKSKALSA